MAKPNNKFLKILEHPDREEIISKLILDMPVSDIHNWLAVKYSATSEAKFVVSGASLTAFKNNYLDIYNHINQDIAATKAAVKSSTEHKLELNVQNNSAYKQKMLDLVNGEIDVRKIIANLCMAIETRVGQVFDAIQEDPTNIDTRVDRLLKEYAETLGNILDKYYKFTEGPKDISVQNNINIAVVDTHISVFHDVIKEVLAQMDLEASLLFMEKFNEKMSALKMENKSQQTMTTDIRVAEAKLLNESVSHKLSEHE